MKQGFLQSSRYSPGNMSRESLEALFVGRDGIMEDVLSRLMKSVKGPEKHFLLLVGPRGSGKTHFIALAHHRLLERLGDADVRNEVLVAELKEEEWGVASFLDLVVRILKAIADQAPSLSARIDTIYERYSKDPDEAEAFATGLLREHAQGKTLMLFCENLLDLFDGLGDEGQRKWRSAIQEDGNWTMVASTPSLFAALTLQDNPFYGFFTIRQLERLDFETAVELMAKKAAHESGHELAGFLRTPLGRARARAIHHLAAGNHRAYVVLFDFLDKESLDDLTTPFMQMVDDLTPYYQDRMRQLPPTQRKIVEFLSRQGVPATIKDIAVPSLMSHQTAAKQIGELASAGFVTRTRIGRNSFCELSEPLMRICMEVKDNRTRHFRLFVEFLRHWFTTGELERRRSAFRHGDQANRVDRIHVEEALKSSYADRKEPFRDALRKEADRCFEADDYGGLATIQETLASDGGQADDHGRWIFALIQKGDLENAIEVGRDAAARFPDHAAIQYLMASAYRLRRELDEALSAIDRAIELDGERFEHFGCLAIILQDLERNGKALDAIDRAIKLDQEQPTLFWQRANILKDLERLDEALKAIDRAIELDQEQPALFWLRADILHDHERLDEALNAIDRAIDLDEEEPGQFWLRACVLQDLGRHDEALNAIDRAIELDQGDPRPFWLQACTLRDLERHDEALNAIDRAIELDAEDSGHFWLRADILQDLERLDEALDAIDRAIELEAEDSGHFWLRADILQDLERLDEALDAIDRAIELDPEVPANFWVRASILQDLESFDEALNAIDRAIELDERRPGSHWLRANILLDLERFDEALEAAQALLDAAPDHPHRHGQIMRKLASLGRPHDAEALARKLVEHAPGNLRALLVASRFHLDQDRLDEAMRLLQSALEIDPDNQDARRLRGQAFFQMSDYRRASEDLRFYASHHPQSLEAHGQLADALLNSGEWEEAVDVAEHLIDLDPEHFHAYQVLGRALVELDSPEDAVAAFDMLLPTEDCEGLLLAASTVRDTGDYASARRYLGRVAELQPCNRNLWMETTRINILEGDFDAATESAARIEALPGCSLLGRLFAAQAAAATRPLHLALDVLGTAFRTEDFKDDEQLHVEAATEILAVSVRSFGPRFLPEGLAKLRSQLGGLADEGVLGRLLTRFLHRNVNDGFAGTLPEWETALEGLLASLEDLSDCRIPLRMLMAALKYARTGDERHLLSLPLEQRQLLENVQ